MEMLRLQAQLHCRLGCRLGCTGPVQPPGPRHTVGEPCGYYSDVQSERGMQCAVRGAMSSVYLHSECMCMCVAAPFGKHSRCTQPEGVG